MNIAVFSSPAHTIPHGEKKILAPWVLTEQLVTSLVAKGHDVTLFAPEGSQTSARLETGGIQSCARMREIFPDTDSYYSYINAQSLLLFRHMASVVKKLNIDVIHVHQSIELLYPALSSIPATMPIICTFHDPIGLERQPALTRISREFPNVQYVSISHAQRGNAQFPFIDTVYNGVDTSFFVPDGIEGERKFLMAGRIVPEKGFTDAILAVVKTNERLMMVGQNSSNRPETKRFFETEIAPHIDGKRVFWEPVLKQEHLLAHYQQAKALLFPIHWEEAFGLVMIEAMACGTPVIAYKRGSVPEIVVDGVTGFIVEKDNIEGLVNAMKRIGEIDRNKCREHVLQKFSIEQMVRGYEHLYEHVLVEHKKSTKISP